MKLMCNHVGLEVDARLEEGDKDGGVEDARRRTVSRCKEGGGKKVRSMGLGVRI